MERFQTLKAQFELLQRVRDFFLKRGFLEVATPPMVENPGMEVHIHPFQVAHAKSGTLLTPPRYLHTSPEFAMKELLSLGFQNIFTIGYVFRDENKGPIHREQFLMLEWYRTNATYLDLMNDCEELIDTCSDRKIKVERVTVQEIIKRYCDIDILEHLDHESLYNVIQKKFPEIPLPVLSQLAWDDLFFLLFLNKVEPELKKYPAILLYEYPYHLSALSTIKESDRRVCERFEIYLHGVELCNAFNELRDIKVQRERFKNQQSEKRALYQYELSEPNVLYRAVERGFPPTGGIALGIERLLLGLGKIRNPFWEQDEN